MVPHFHYLKEVWFAPQNPLITRPYSFMFSDILGPIGHKGRYLTHSCY